MVQFVVELNLRNNTEHVYLTFSSLNHHYVCNIINGNNLISYLR
jgi:hypothetical protein